MYGRGVVARFGLGLVACSLVACWRSAPPPSSPVAAAEPPPPPPEADAKPTAASRSHWTTVQPVRIEKQEVPAPADGGDVNGVEGGVVGGDLNGVVAAPPPPPPPPPPSLPQNVPPTALDANRIAGEKNILPDDATKAEISQSGKAKLIGSYKLCLTAEGNISSVTQLKSIGFQAYDQKLIGTIRSRWRYRPFMVNGKAAPVCSSVTFIYVVPAAPANPANPPAGAKPPAP